MKLPEDHWIHDHIQETQSPEGGLDGAATAFIIMIVLGVLYGVFCCF